MSLAVRCLAEPLRSLAFGSISGTYAAIGTALAHPAHMILFQNQTNATVTISMDGINDHFTLLANGYFVLDISGNKAASSYGFYISKGTIFYVKGTVGSGNVQVSVFYGDES